MLKKMKSESVLNEIAKKHNISENSISDHVNVYSHDYMIDIDVYYENKNDALSILHDLEDALLEYNDYLSSVIVNNDLIKVSETTYTDAYEDIVHMQENEISTINELIENLKNLKNKITELEKPELSNTSNNGESFLKQFIKYGFFGFISTFLIMCVSYVLAFIFSDKVYSIDEFKKKTKLEVLGNLTYKKEKDKFNLWINKLEKRPDSNNFKLIASNIKAYGINKVMLSSDFEDEIIKDIVSNLTKELQNVEIICRGNLLTDSNAINELKNVDSVILIVKCNESIYKTIGEEKEKLNNLKVANVYAIVVE